MIKIVTISREFGSGGRTIGKEVAEKLGMPCYDKDFIEKIAEETGYAKEFIADESEYAPNGNSLAYMFIGRGLDGLSNADKIWIAQKKVIEELAEKGACVIVGRCADYVLRERKDVLNVFVYADKKYRAERIVKQYGESSVEPEKRLADKDKKRKLNYKYFTEQEWGKRQNYHLSIDSGFLGIEKPVVGLVLHLKANKEIKNTLAYIKPSGRIIKGIYSIGFAAIIAQALMSVMTYLLNVIFVRIGENVVTAYGLYYKIQQFILFSAFGLRDAITPIVSFNHGMGSKERVKDGIKYGLIYTLGIMLIGFVGLEVFVELVISGTCGTWLVWMSFVIAEVLSVIVSVVFMKKVNTKKVMSMN